MTNAVSRRIESIKARADVSAANIAQIVGTTAQTLSRWSAGMNEPHREHLRALLALDLVAEQLSGIFAPGDVKRWLLSPNQQLAGMRPVDLLAEGRFHDVQAVIERLCNGAYV